MSYDLTCIVSICTSDHSSPPSIPSYFSYSIPQLQLPSTHSPTSTNLPFPHISVPFLTFSSPTSTPIFKPYLNFPLLTSGADTGGGGTFAPPDRFREGRSPPEISRQKMFPICYNNFLNLFNRLYPFFKLFDIKYKKKNLVYQIIDKKKRGTQNKEQKQVSLPI